MKETAPHINPQIFKKFKVKLAYLFGSRVKGNAAPESDFDIAVLFEKDGGRIDYFDKTVYLAVELRDYFPTEVEVVALNQAGSLLKYEVIAHRQILYCKNERERRNFEVLTMKEYIDEEPLRNLYNQALYKRILQGA